MPEETIYELKQPVPHICRKEEYCGPCAQYEFYQQIFSNV